MEVLFPVVALPEDRVPLLVTSAADLIISLGTVWISIGTFSDHDLTLTAFFRPSSGYEVLRLR